MVLSAFSMEHYYKITAPIAQVCIDTNFPSALPVTTDHLKWIPIGTQHKEVSLLFCIASSLFPFTNFSHHLLDEFAVILISRVFIFQYKTTHIRPVHNDILIAKLRPGQVNRQFANFLSSAP